MGGRGPRDWKEELGALDWWDEGLVTLGRSTGGRWARDWMEDLGSWNWREDGLMTLDSSPGGLGLAGSRARDAGSLDERLAKRPEYLGCKRTLQSKNGMRYVVGGIGLSLIRLGSISSNDMTYLLQTVCFSSCVKIVLPCRLGRTKQNLTSQPF